MSVCQFVCPSRGGGSEGESGVGSRREVRGGSGRRSEGESKGGPRGESGVGPEGGPRGSGGGVRGRGSMGVVIATGPKAS